MFRPKITITTCLRILLVKGATNSQIIIENSEDSNFLARSELETLNDGHFRPKHVVMKLLFNFK
jgi:hypothetical protein